MLSHMLPNSKQQQKSKDAKITSPYFRVKASGTGRYRDTNDNLSSSLVIRWNARLLWRSRAARDACRINNYSHEIVNISTLSIGQRVGILLPQKESLSYDTGTMSNGKRVTRLINAMTQRKRETYYFSSRWTVEVDWKSIRLRVDLFIIFWYQQEAFRP